MINNYREFLGKKDGNSFWKIAKQLSLHEDNAVDKILQYLTNDFDNLTTRNSIPLRYLGFIINEGSDHLKLSEAGKTFIRLPYKQKILDEQLMKVYLNSNDTGNRLKLDVVPLKIFLTLIKKLEYFTFLEYKLFICWISNESELDSVEYFIKDMRDNAIEEECSSILQEKIEELNIDDFSDHVKRFFDILLLSSYFYYNKETEIASTILSEKDIDIIINTFDNANFSNDSYYEYLIHNDGWNAYTKEKREITRQIVNEEVAVVSLEDIQPVEIDLKIATQSQAKPKKYIVKKKPFKIDFAVRYTKNREAGDRSEKIMMEYEKDKLISMQCLELSEKVKQVSLEDDSLGYDVLSFNADGSEKHIEVKGVKNTPNTKFNFYISSSEMQVACEDNSYSLYIVFDYLSEKPMIFKMPDKIFSGDVISGITITPKKYLVEIAIDKDQ